VRVASLGGGPGGLYSAILLKRADPDNEITVYERNAPDDTFGFGVVFSAATLAELEDADAPSYDAIMRACARWDPVDIHYRGAVVRARGNRFAAVSRKRLLQLLQHRAAEAGATLEFSTEVDPADHLDADLVLGADGVNSATRERFADVFRPQLATEGGKFIWLGTPRPLDSFTFIFRETEHGWFQVHAYPYDEAMSTWIVECDPQTWRRAGLDRGGPLPPGVSDEHAVAFLSELFALDLDGHPLVANNSKWLDWRTVRTRTWRHGTVVLLGDACHTAHFSIGSGTKLAMEDAIALARALAREPDREAALEAYEADRKPVVDRWQDIAGESMRWFLRYPRYAHFPPAQFGYSLLARSGRVSYENAKARDPALLAAF
jgi:anthraniloyl-CoA monooxygenase